MSVKEMWEQAERRTPEEDMRDLIRSYAMTGLNFLDENPKLAAMELRHAFDICVELAHRVMTSAKTHASTEKAS